MSCTLLIAQRPAIGLTGIQAAGISGVLSVTQIENVLMKHCYAPHISDSRVMSGGLHNPHTVTLEPARLVYLAAGPDHSLVVVL